MARKKRGRKEEQQETFSSRKDLLCPTINSLRLINDVFGTLDYRKREGKEK